MSEKATNCQQQTDSNHFLALNPASCKCWVRNQILFLAEQNRFRSHKIIFMHKMHDCENNTWLTNSREIVSTYKCCTSCRGERPTQHVSSSSQHIVNRQEVQLKNLVVFYVFLVLLLLIIPQQEFGGLVAAQRSTIMDTLTDYSYTQNFKGLSYQYRPTGSTGAFSVFEVSNGVQVSCTHLSGLNGWTRNVDSCCMISNTTISAGSPTNCPKNDDCDPRYVKS